MSDENEMHMDDGAWTSRIEKITTYINKHGKELRKDEDSADSLDIIEMNINRGNKRPNMRKKYWSSILLEGRSLDNWPIKKGKESSLPQNVQTALTDLGAAVQEAYTNFWNDNPIVQQVEVISDRNKEQGGSPYESAEEYAKGKVMAVRQRFTKYYNDERWSGDFTLDDGFNISPPPPAEGDSQDD